MQEYDYSSRVERSTTPLAVPAALEADMHGGGSLGSDCRSTSLLAFTSIGVDFESEPQSYPFGCSRYHVGCPKRCHPNWRLGFSLVAVTSFLNLGGCIGSVQADRDEGDGHGFHGFSAFVGWNPF